MGHAVELSWSESNPWSWLLHAVEIGGALLATAMTLVLLQQRKDPRSLVAWSMSFFLFPFVGPLIYLGFGEPRLKLRARRRAHATGLGPRVHDDGPRGVPGEPFDALVHKMLSRFNPFPARPGNRIELLPDGEASFARMFEDIGAARKTVHVEFYLIRADRTGRDLSNLLKAKAREGVEVRLLYDHVGSLLLHAGWVADLNAHGVAVRPFLPVNLLRRQFHINFRNHRKIVAVDGQVAYTGGINVGDEYRTGQSKWGRWQDLAVRIEGPVVRDFEAVFADDWMLATGEELTLSPYPEPLTDGTLMQLVPGGPDQDHHAIRLLFTTLIARVNTELLAATPYFVPEQSDLHLLESAHMRGARVDLIVPRVGNHWWVHQATSSFLGDLLAVGIAPRIYEPGMLHTKAMTLDRRIGVVGSPNLDMRSFRLNFELALLLYDDRDVAALAEHLDSLLREAPLLEAEAWRARPWRQRVLQGLARAFGPVM